MGDRKQVATKSTRSSHWFVRIDGVKEHLEAKCKTLAESVETVAILGAYHTGEKGENPHAHFVITLRSEPQKQSFADRIKRLFGVEHKSQYALSVWDGQRGAGACSYLFHEEGAPLIVCNGFTDDEIDEARRANDATQKVIAVNKEKASTKFVDRALAHFDSCPTERELLAYMLRLSRDGQLYWPGTFKAKQMIEEVRIRMHDNFEELVDEFHFKIFR